MTRESLLSFPHETKILDQEPFCFIYEQMDLIIHIWKLEVGRESSSSCHPTRPGCTWKEPVTGALEPEQVELRPRQPLVLPWCT